MNAQTLSPTLTAAGHAPALHDLEAPGALPLTLREDTPLAYTQSHRQGLCRLRLYMPEARPLSETNPAVAIVTEMPEVGGLSITNGIEAIAGAIAYCYGLSPRHTVLIEHYDDRQRGFAARLPGRIKGEKFCCVTFGEMQAFETEMTTYQVRRPQWKSLTKAEVELLLGAPLS